ncbi:MAG: DM13 domain-containing protein [Calditrichaeota bacterium]|nr:DM13 domain-containing protein [Calditrichota bacterium]
MIYFVFTLILFNFQTDSIRTGQFIEIEHDVVGTVTVAVKNDQLLISFSANFETDEGPDLFVMLSSAADEHQKSDMQVAALQRFEGEQRYTINGISIKQFGFVQIWCKEYDVVFGSAKLSD